MRILEMSESSTDLVSCSLHVSILYRELISRPWTRRLGCWSSLESCSMAWKYLQTQPYPYFIWPKLPVIWARNSLDKVTILGHFVHFLTKMMNLRALLWCQIARDLVQVTYGQGRSYECQSVPRKFLSFISDFSSHETVQKNAFYTRSHFFPRCFTFLRSEKMKVLQY
jgi:hypothetical protein